MTFKQAIKKIIGAEAPQAVPELGRNQICWCGSGKKYKQCHLSSDERRRANARAGGGSASSSGLGF